MVRWCVVVVVGEVQDDESWSEEREEGLAEEPSGCEMVLEERLVSRRRLAVLRVVLRWYGIVMAREPGGWAGSAISPRCSLSQVPSC